MKTGKLIGVYPGTFDPFTFGHLDIVKRGCTLVDRLIIGVTTNPQKAALFTAHERVQHIVRETKGVGEASNTAIKVVAFDKLLMDFAVENHAHIIIRGLRAVSDFEYEFQMAGMNAALNPEVETVFLMADAKLQPIASKLVKEIAAFGGDITPFVSAAVAAAVAAKMKR
jgi:pantetheine-phosphate adenylyltransferase